MKAKKSSRSVGQEMLTGNEYDLSYLCFMLLLLLFFFFAINNRL